MSLEENKPVKYSREDWIKSCDKWSNWNYYASANFVFVHPLIMFFLYDAWANFNFLLLAYSLQMLMLGVYCWSIGDEKYEYWIKKHIWFFYLLGSLNILGFFMGISIGGYMFMYSPGIVSFYGFSIMTFMFLNVTSLVVAVGVGYTYILYKFYWEPKEDKEEEISS